MGTYFIRLFNITASSLHRGLNPEFGPLEGLGHWVLGEDAHQLLYIYHQGGCNTVGGFIDISFKNAPYKLVRRTAFWAAGRPDLLKNSLREEGLLTL